MSHYELDARRLLCPLPVIRAQDKVSSLVEGDTLTVICTDPGAKNDIPSWSRINGHEILEIVEEENQIYITIKVKKSGQG